MTETNLAKFQFIGYSISKALIEVKKNEIGDTYSVSFEPKGKIDNTNSMFYLSLKILINDSKKLLYIEVCTTAKFKFNKKIPLKELDNYFFINAPAIVFPYIRAYIGTLTNLSGYNAINLPTLNLTALP